jgi:hypothetical protein
MNYDHLLDVVSQLIALLTLALYTWQKMKGLDNHLDAQDKHLAEQDQHLERHAIALEELKKGDTVEDTRRGAHGL